MTKALFYLAIILPPMWLYHYMHREGFKQCNTICKAQVAQYSVFQCVCKE